MFSTVGIYEEPFCPHTQIMVYFYIIIKPEWHGQNVAQVYSIWTGKKAMIQPLELMCQNCGCWEGPVMVYTIV